MKFGSEEYVQHHIKEGWDGKASQICYNYVGRVLKQHWRELVDDGAKVVMYKLPRIGYIHGAIVCSDGQRIESNINSIAVQKLKDAESETFSIQNVVDFISR